MRLIGTEDGFTMNQPEGHTLAERFRAEENVAPTALFRIFPAQTEEYRTAETFPDN